MPETLETIIAISLGIGLAAACGFRIFVPMFVISICANADWLSLSESFEWVGSPAAMIAFGVATVLEIGAYYVPWLDNLLDTIATPAAAIAGVLVTAAFVSDMHPLLAWSVSIIAGGGVAGTIKTGMAGIRIGSTTTTAGVANPVVSTFESVSALSMSLLSIIVPIAAAILALILTAVLLRFAFIIWRRFYGSQPKPITEEASR